MAILVEVFAQAPFYAVALFAWIRRRSWIRTPAIMYSVVLLTILPIVLAEQYYGEHATAKPILVTAVYSPYVIMPLLMLARVLPSTDLFPDAAAHRDDPVTDPTSQSYFSSPTVTDPTSHPTSQLPSSADAQRGNQRGNQKGNQRGNQKGGGGKSPSVRRSRSPAVRHAKEA